MIVSDVPVEVDDQGRAGSMTGDKENALYKGYGCVKGRALPAIHNSPDRLHHTSIFDAKVASA